MAATDDHPVEDLAARVQELTEGWQLARRLVLSSRERSRTLLQEAFELAVAFELLRLLADARPADPTNKEREVLRLLSRNLSNKEIGRVLHAGETTVKWHVKNLFAKLGVGSRREVVVRARALGWLPDVD